MAGHGGVTGRYSQWEETAVRVAGLTDQLGVDEVRSSGDADQPDE